MCGIFTLVNQDIELTKDKIYAHISKNKKRGPEVENFYVYDKNLVFCFHRLAINGLNAFGNQPLFYKKYLIIGNGEIFNYKELIIKHNLTPKSNSDIEVLLYLYELYGTDLLKHINGEFSFILYDGLKKEMMICRDPFGIRPLYYNFIKSKIIEQYKDFTVTREKDKFVFSSTLSSLVDMDGFNNNKIRQFNPGCFMILKLRENDNFYYFDRLEKYHILKPEIHHNFITNRSLDLYYKFKKAIEIRVLTSERPIGALLSGGLDSSLVCSLAQQILKENNKPSLTTFSIGLYGSEDLKYSKLVADHIGSNHHQIILQNEDFLEAIPKVIYDIESYDTTTVRASTGNWLIGKYIKENTDIKVVLNGDGADELMGGYLYFHKAPNDILFDGECRRLLSEIHYFDVLRSDRSIASHGLEARTPMLDKDFVNTYLSRDINERNHVNYNKYYIQKPNIEKYLIRNTIELNNPNLLPKEILWRQKEAFSDGVSSMQKSWYEIIQDFLTDKINNDETLKREIEDLIYPFHLNCDTLEQKYYYYIFNKHYKNCEHLIPHYWMPNFINAQDSSARTLKQVYKKNV